MPDSAWAAEIEGMVTPDDHRMLRSEDCRSALDAVQRHSPDVILIEDATALADGHDDFRALRTATTVALVVLALDGDEIHELLAFADGADDYIRMPCSPRVLRARIAAAMRRAQSSTPHVEATHTAGPLTVDTSLRRATLQGTPLALTRTEFNLLCALIENRQRVLPRAELISRVWGDWAGDGHVLDVHLSRLRAKIVTAGGPRIALAVPGVGYTLGIDAAQTR
jgi:DNA-binding response OmpR family regulator